MVAKTKPIETYYVRFTGGPFDGDTRPITSDRMPFPPPEVEPWPEFGGRYIRDAYSQLPEGVSPHVARGASYHWEREGTDGD